MQLKKAKKRKGEEDLQKGFPQSSEHIRKIITSNTITEKKLVTDMFQFYKYNLWDLYIMNYTVVCNNCNLISYFHSKIYFPMFLRKNMDKRMTTSLAMSKG